MTALYLNRSGVEAEVFEQSSGIRELGVGINILPHAGKVLANLGLLETLDRAGIRTGELVYQNRFGQTIWRQPCGLEAGYDFPQFSIHRGRLQGVLYDAVKMRVGEGTVKTGHRLTGFDQGDSGVTARFARREGGEAEARGNVMIVADGVAPPPRREDWNR